MTKWEWIVIVNEDERFTILERIKGAEDGGVLLTGGNDTDVEFNWVGHGLPQGFA